MNDMLKTRPMQPGEVFGFKDVAGEEFIGKVISLNDTEVVVQWPCHYSSAGDGSFRVSSAHRIALHGMIIVQRCNIIASYRILGELFNAYEEFIQKA
jgi:hypothetical protein